MKANKDNPVSRRNFIKTSALTTLGLTYLNTGKTAVSKPMTRPFGKLNFDVTSFALGGQASIQWTPSDVDPVKIILKAFDMKTNYFDTSNVYGPSQNNYGIAFRELDLIPGRAGYNEPLRRSIFLTSKTGLRWAKGGREIEGAGSFTNGPDGSHTIDDIKRTLTQVFGDGKGSYPKGAYIDMVLIHSLSNMAAVDVLYEGYHNPDPGAEHIGALAGLLDYRDGTNTTGLNPKEEKLIRHIGFSGHHSSPVMMEMIQRDDRNILDGMLVAINANDRLNLNMQYNVIPVASAKNMGIIAMKTFADGAMYTKPADWSRRPEHVVRTVGSKEVSSRKLVEYTLSIPGIHTDIIGIGQISDDASSCQLTSNMSSAQIAAASLSETERREIEVMANTVKGGETNYFQLPKEALSQPREVAAKQEVKGGQRVVKVAWQTAYAGDEPITHYEVRRDNGSVSRVAHKSQTTKNPFTFVDTVSDKNAHTYTVAAVDAAGRRAVAGEISVSGT